MGSPRFYTRSSQRAAAIAVGAVLSCVCWFICASAAPASAQVQQVSGAVTSWGVPDLSGVWSNDSVTTLQRPTNMKAVLTPAEAQSFEESQRDYRNVMDVSDGADALTVRVGALWGDTGTSVGSVRGEFRSSWIIEPDNGRLPFTEAGRALLAGHSKLYVGDKGEQLFRGPESRGMAERCMWASAPIMLNGDFNERFEIIQTQGFAVINLETAHDARIIPIVSSAKDAEARFGPSDIPKWMGDSVGWYEGMSLIVWTRNTRAEQQGGVLLSERGQTVERFTRAGDGEILYEFSVEDPIVYSQRWRGEMPLRRVDASITEFACHEGNYGLVNVLLGARTQDELR